MGTIRLTWLAWLMSSGAVAILRSYPFLRHSPEEVPGDDSREEAGLGPMVGWHLGCGQGSFTSSISWPWGDLAVPSVHTEPEIWGMEAMGEDICQCGTCCQWQRQSQ